MTHPPRRAFSHVQSEAATRRMVDLLTPFRCALVTVVFFILALTTAGSRTVADDRTIGPSGRPLPRFVSLKASEVRMRSGPGVGYPIEWVYRRAGLPVEVVAEYDTWRRVRDFEGDEGWVHQTLLDGRRTGLVIGGLQELRAASRLDAAIVARAEAGVVVGLDTCTDGWCQVAAEGVTGWLPNTAIFGLLPGERLE